MSHTKMKHLTTVELDMTVIMALDWRGEFVNISRHIIFLHTFHHLTVCVWDGEMGWVNISTCIHKHTPHNV
uniref:Uncharacterized protein n=1 Tax=Arion vulgaris TaxID=1028688 RepID=A0A0B6Y3F2_9EUPU